MISRKINVKEIIPSTLKVFSHLITLSETKILFNCGLKNDLDTSIYDSFKEEIKNIDFILLNHFDLNFLAALPYFYKNGFRGKIFCTLPIKTFGKILLLENFNSKLVLNHKLTFSQADIEKIFEEIQSIKYLQPIEIGQGLRITAYNSGYGLGGSVWRINLEEDSLLFSIYFDHKKSNHLNGIDFSLPKNSIFFCDSSYISSKPFLRKERNAELKEQILKTLKLNKRILILIDYLQFMELALILDDILIQLNTGNKIKKASCIGFCAKIFSESIKGMIEWSGDILMKDFSEVKENPFSFKFIDFFDKFTQMQENDIFICFSEDVFAMKILKLIKEDDKNLIINFINEKIHEDLQIRKIPIFQIKEIKKVELEESTSSLSQEEEIINEAENWYDIDTEVYIQDKELFFPVPKKIKKIDEYNKMIPFDVTKQQIKEIIIEEKEVEEKEIIEEIQMKEDSFTFRNKILVYNLKSVSDFKSSLNVFESLCPKKIVVLKTQKNLSKIFYYKLKLNKAFEEVLLLEDQLDLYSQKGYMTVGLSSEFNNLNYRTINENSYLSFEGMVCKNELKFLKENQDCTVIGELNFKELKRKILENGLFVENINDSKINIANEVIIEKKDNNIFVEGEYTALYYFVMDILNNFVFYV
ncbi:beta-CASP domain-containing protein [Tubulinosema ratisbonensis]|uniref:Cleavage and polyadenylation specificity factor subunit 2 n=1 Tax=Tubulinosema ratisbonensis TaxID=291195 RepID=A0A437AM32_9MICR|nr:beta-CASP domain-containing protein [Tubulinosema ratisbonensis]